MKLLSKNEISIAKAKDRNLESQEGLKLAKRVDSLRETVSQEEASLQKFRNKTISQITNEISSEINKRDALKDEVSDLEQRRIAALIPLNKELEMIKQRQQVADDKQAALCIWRDELDDKDTELTEREKQVMFEEKRSKDMHIRTESLLIETDTIRSNAEQQNILASETLRKAEQESFVKMKEVSKKEEWVKERERAIGDREIDVEMREAQLAQDLIRLRDREEIYTRNFNRLRK